MVVIVGLERSGDSQIPAISLGWAELQSAQSVPPRRGPGRLHNPSTAFHSLTLLTSPTASASPSPEPRSRNPVLVNPACASPSLSPRMTRTRDVYFINTGCGQVNTALMELCIVHHAL